MMSIDQLVIALTGVISAWVLNAPTEQVRRWGCIIGLIGQYFWFQSTWSHAQWGMFAVTVGYTVAFMRGFWVLWVRPRIGEAGFLFNPSAWWIGAHYSPANQRWCINVLPCTTLWLTLPGGKVPERVKL